MRCGGLVACPTTRQIHMIWHETCMALANFSAGLTTSNESNDRSKLCSGSQPRTAQGPRPPARGVPASFLSVVADEDVR
jgi:hypothetical protein